MVGFSLHGGEAEQWDPFLRRWEGGRAGADVVYGLVEVSAGPPREVAEIVWQAVDETFQRTPPSITRVLRDALSAAHESLSEFSGRGWRAGMTLVTVRSGEIYFAWVAPSSVSLSLQEGGLDRGLVAVVENGEPLATLGGASRPEPYLATEHAIDIRSVLVSWRSLDKLTTDDALDPLLATGGENAIQSLYRLAVGERNFAALVVDIGEQDGGRATLR